MVEYDFEGDAVAITGAASGIGRETALGFGRNGGSVVVADIDLEAAQTVAAEIADAGGAAVAVEADVTDLDDMERMVETAVDEFGSLDCAVNNAGIGGAQQPIRELDESDWERTMDVNLTGVWRALRAELDRMVEQETGGAVVNTASVLGQVATKNAADYVAAKHGVVGLTKTAAWECADEGVRVNAVCPGFVETKMLEETGIADSETLFQRILAMHSQGRVGQPDEIADAILWLCSDAASFTNGEALTVDSGYTAI